MSILVTGGAGYVGSAVVEGLQQQGYKTVILDNLQQGYENAVPPGAKFIHGDIRDREALSELFTRFDIDAVMHMAAETVIEFSMTDPKRHFENNVANGIALLDAMLKNRIDKLIFSSTAAVYGEPETIPIEEDHPKKPINAYGESKLMFEHILKWYGMAYGLKHISFRYFNAAGASPLVRENHNPETHLIPNVLNAALDKNNPVSIFGTNYPTKDGTCIRDYVHVTDIAQAHILALEKLDKFTGMAYNLGSNQGYSVLEIVETSRKVTGIDIPIKFSPRRPGDPAALIASSARVKAELDWKPQFIEIETIIESAWRLTKK